VSLASATSWIASKYLKTFFLIDPEEMEAFLEYIQPISIFCTSRVIDDQVDLSTKEFLSIYRRYVQEIKTTLDPQLDFCKQAFHSIFTKDRSILESIDLKGGKKLYRTKQPAVQLRACFIGYSSIDDTFHPMSLGKRSIPWGIMVSFPQIVQNPKTQEILDAKEFVDYSLYRKMTKWMRSNTTPTPFSVHGKTVVEPVRLGKKCFGWIDDYPFLKELQIKVEKR